MAAQGVAPRLGKQNGLGQFGTELGFVLLYHVAAGAFNCVFIRFDSYGFELEMTGK